MDYKTTIETPSYGKHIVFLGGTGSGKTYLAKQLLNYYNRQFIFDIQENFNTKDYKVTNTPKEVITEIKKDTDKIIYQPIIEAQEREFYNYILKKILYSSKPKDKRKRIIYIDEVYHIGYKQSFPENLAIGFATARQKDISFWVATQRPVCIPTNVLTEASKIYIFALTKADDIKYISSFAPLGREKELFDGIKSLDRTKFEFIELDTINQEIYLHNKII